MTRTVRTALCVVLLAAPLAAIPRSASGEIVDVANAERIRLNRAVMAGLGGAVVAYYCQRMDYAWFHHVMPRRFTATESAFLLGGWIAILTYSGTLAALSRSGTAQAPAGPPELPLAWPMAGVDGDGHAFAGAGMRF